MLGDVDAGSRPDARPMWGSATLGLSRLPRILQYGRPRMASKFVARKGGNGTYRAGKELNTSIMY